VKKFSFNLFNFFHVIKINAVFYRPNLLSWSSFFTIIFTWVLLFLCHYSCVYVITTSSFTIIINLCLPFVNSLLQYFISINNSITITIYSFCSFVIIRKLKILLAIISSLQFPFLFFFLLQIFLLLSHLFIFLNFFFSFDDLFSHAFL